jgi:hypothetical protein
MGRDGNEGRRLGALFRIKALAQLDGAFVITERGLALAACRAIAQPGEQLVADGRRGSRRQAPRGRPRPRRR